MSRKFTVGYLTHRSVASEFCHTKAAFVHQLLGVSELRGFVQKVKGALTAAMASVSVSLELRRLGKVQT